MNAEEQQMKEWVQWTLNNTEVAEKETPELLQAIKNDLWERPPIIMANLMDKLPTIFEEQNKELDRLLSNATKIQKIKEWLGVIDSGLLYRTNNNIEQAALNKWKSEFEARKIYLENELKKLETLSQTAAAPQQTQTVPQFIVNQIALIHVYNGIIITRENGKSIAMQYAHASGEKLFQRYTFYSSRQNRTGQENTKKKTQNKINLIESVIPYLSEANKQRATDELNTLKTTLNNE
ncbi:MAG: hypothetical protein KF900_06900 [Bacteroidetes bacterium]|nr:hypothetical protein [Bacteroidota bacterium]